MSNTTAAASLLENTNWSIWGIAFLLDMSVRDVEKLAEVAMETPMEVKPELSKV